MRKKRKYHVMILRIYYTASKLRNPSWNQSISRGSLSGYWQPLSRGPAPPSQAQSTAAQHLAATSATSCHVPGSRGSDCRIMPLYPAWTCPATGTGSFQNCLSNYWVLLLDTNNPKIVTKHGRTENSQKYIYFQYGVMLCVP